MMQSGSGRPLLADHLFVLGAWVIACLVLFASLGAAPLTDLDEGAFSEATREMMARGDWISPWLLDAPRFDKPALIHWLQMAAFSVTGFSSYGARLPSALMGLIWIGGIGGWAYLIARRVAPAVRVQAYGWAVLISATCLGIPAMSRAATADATLNAFLVLSLLFTWRALWPEKESETGTIWIRLAAVFIGLGLLTKGPIAVLVPGAASLLAVLTCGRFKRLLKLAFDPLVWFIVLIIAAPWYLLQFQAQGMAFVEGFLGLHNLGRFTSTMHGFSAGPLYYPAWMLIATLPWTVPVLGSLFGVAGSGPGARILRSPELRLAWVVFVFVVVFFSFSATKLPHYGFYGLSGLVVIVSLWLTAGALSQSVGLRIAVLLSLLAGTIAVTSAPLWFPTVNQTVSDPYFQVVLADAATHLQGKMLPFAALACAGTAGFLIGLSRFRGGVATLALTTAIAAYGLIVPTIMQSLREPIAQMGQFIRSQTVDQNASQTAGQGAIQPKRIITWHLTAPSLSFAAQRVIPGGSPLLGDWVALPTHLISKLPNQETTAAHVLFEKTGISLIEIRAKP
jgi:4-amino-4-deoxy-L-arabinose transferase-like glycosyltransferase